MNAEQATVVDITSAALAQITEEAKCSIDGLETGGILLGHDTQGSLTVRHAGDPGPKAQRGARTFLRDRDYAQEFANNAWLRDQSLWIGEWHTHLGNGLAPSEIDLTSYLRHLHDPDLQLDRFLSIIVGLGPDGISAATWLITREYTRQVPLRRIND